MFIGFGYLSKVRCSWCNALQGKTPSLSTHITGPAPNIYPEELAFTFTIMLAAVRVSSEMATPFPSMTSYKEARKVYRSCISPARSFAPLMMTAIRHVCLCKAECHHLLPRPHHDTRGTGKSATPRISTELFIVHHESVDEAIGEGFRKPDRHMQQTNCSTWTNV